jgi:hypothetical protein
MKTSGCEGGDLNPHGCYPLAPQGIEAAGDVNDSDGLANAVEPSKDTKSQAGESLRGAAPRKKRGPYKLRPASDRFWPKVDKSGDCWLWLGFIDHAGYGRFRVGGRAGKSERAHRAAWEMTVAPIPAGMELCHHCDNPRCVRPDHMFVGTHAENMADAAAKKRFTSPLGELSGRARFKDGDVLEMHRLHASGLGYRRIAKLVGTTKSTVYYVLTGRRWPHIKAEFERQRRAS